MARLRTCHMWSSRRCRRIPVLYAGEDTYSRHHMYSEAGNDLPSKAEPRADDVRG